jgi:hypothetical protein
MKKIIFNTFAIVLLSQTVIADGFGSGAKSAIKSAASTAIKTITQDVLDGMLKKASTVKVTVQNGSVIIATNKGDWQLSIDSNLASNVLKAHDEIKVTNSTLKATNTGSYVIVLGSNVGSNKFQAAKIEISNSQVTAINEAGKSFFLFSNVGSNDIGQE